MIHIVPSANKRKPYMVAKTGTIELSNGKTMYIHAGYLTDYASIPSFLPLDNVGEEKDAYIAHDYMYNYRGYFTNEKLTHFEPISQVYADKEMRRLMLKLGATEKRAKWFYRGVRLFSWLKLNNFGKI